MRQKKKQKRNTFFIFFEFLRLFPYEFWIELFTVRNFLFIDLSFNSSILVILKNFFTLVKIVNFEKIKQNSRQDT